jgi:hypothetical protein
MKKKFLVRFSFINEFEAETDVAALIDAAYAVKYGQETVRHLELKVVNVQPLPQQAETPALVEEAPAATEIEKNPEMPF